MGIETLWFTRGVSLIVDSFIQQRITIMLLYILFLSTTFSGAFSLKCNSAMDGDHGLTWNNTKTEETCKAGILNCYKITASGGGVVGKVYGWGCGNNQVQTGCVQGLPQGMIFDVGPQFDSIQTCLCTTPLCNEEHFCDDCKSGASSSVVVSLILVSVTLPSGLSLL